MSTWHKVFTADIAGPPELIFDLVADNVRILAELKRYVEARSA
ncbi:MAG: hypothetical protein ACLP19_20650 [Xanthobacteraceae bacterium]